LGWSLLFLAIDIASIVSSAIFGARVLLRRTRLANAQLIALIAFDSICYVALARYDYRHWIPAPYQIDIGAWAGVLNFARNLTPGLFMVLCFNLFADATRFPRWLLALFVVQMAVEVIAYWGAPQSGALIPLALRLIPSVLQTLFVGAALYWTVANWAADLLEARRRARVIITIIIGFNIVGSSLLLRVLVSQNSIANYETHLALLAANLAVTLVMLICFTDEDLTAPLEAAKTRRIVIPPATVEASDALARLRDLLDDEHVYRRPSLTLKDLADLVGLPEYRMRKLINEQLGYQNFNAFLHDYRIREACRQLRDPRMRRIPILTIALSTGYQSINTFNRGFREIMGMTPSAYRAVEPTETSEPAAKTSPQSA